MKQYLLAGFMLLSVQEVIAQNDLKANLTSQIKKFTSPFTQKQISVDNTHNINTSFTNYDNEGNDEIIIADLKISVIALRYAEEMAPVEVKEDDLLSLSLKRKSHTKLTHMLGIADMDFLIGSSRLYKMIVVLNF